MKTMPMTWMWAIFLALLAIAAAAPPDAHAGLNDAMEPGSVLVFPYFATGTVFGRPRTEIEISATCPRGATCNAHEPVRLRAMWVCPPTTNNPACGKAGFDLHTTLKGTLFFHPNPGISQSLPGFVDLGNADPPPPTPPCGRGFLIVWVVDEFRRPIKFDGLIGNAVIREQQSSAVGYNAVGIQAGLLLPVRARTDLNRNGKLDFNGIEYMPITGKIFGTVRYEGPDVSTVPPELLSRPAETRLILLTLDVVAGEVNPATHVGLDFFTADEILVPASLEMVCWTRLRLTAINPALTAADMGRKGLVESTSATQGDRAVTLLGLVETAELGGAQAVSHDWIYSLNTGGRPVPTTFSP